MINKATFELEHIRSLQKSSGSDPILIERSLYAFGLLEALVRVGMPFIFNPESVLQQFVIRTESQMPVCRVLLDLIDCKLVDVHSSSSPWR